MTALIYHYERDLVFIAMDSLALDEQKNPFKYVTKFYILPHLNCIVCGTGLFRMITKWIDFVQNSMIFKDVIDLNKQTPTDLRKISNELELPDNGSSTIYHFGVDAKDKRMVAYAYRSKNLYKSEELIYGLGIKPDYENVIQIALESIKKEGLINGSVEIIKYLKNIDDNLDLESRLGIGGEIHSVLLSKEGKYSIETIYRFSDYDNTFSKMLKNQNVKRV
ncbi:MAG: hypothetical protein ACTSR8_11980 [Promethearchaeota archaeon]